MAKYVDIEKAEKDLKKRCDIIFKATNEKVKSEDYFIPKNDKLVVNLSKSLLESFMEFYKARATSEVEEVVHCKNCQYFDEATVDEKGFFICPASGMEITEYDFCSYGEKGEQK